MKTPTEEKKLLSFLLETLMIGLETFYSFVFKHDNMVQQQAQPFVSNNIVLKVNCYIPYFNFYVSFTNKGLLFNLNTPEQKTTLEISSTIFGYVQALALGNKRSIYGIKIYTEDATTKDQLRDFLISLSLPHLGSDWKKWIFTPSHKKDTTSSPLRTSALLEKIDQQRAKINHLYVENKQLKNRVRHIQSSQKRINIIFFIITLSLIIALIYSHVH
ncbi:hypothetical protein [Acinetobacter rathckeae]|uniref:hypothetical protein n=1 Tax=Acinetobacter rathckeae TaxID=2605272 RepID=UPI0018A26C61|nr:hypothetical protein [Acinetobacter rathckeae]MBF7687191.1 hypothetical protein [Acinetobacter rathckeae]MBF7694456.1 hypothetical protein [Acinetobacter rathckeae]